MNKDRIHRKGIGHQTSMLTARAANSGRLDKTPLYRSASALTILPVNVAKSIIKSGWFLDAKVSVSANTMRPSASVCMISMVVPFNAVTTSFCLYANGLM